MSLSKLFLLSSLRATHTRESVKSVHACTVHQRAKCALIITASPPPKTAEPLPPPLPCSQLLLPGVALEPKGLHRDVGVGTGTPYITRLDLDLHVPAHS